MKHSLIVLLTAIMTSAAFAQTETSLSTEVDRFEAGHGQKGITVGAEYMNITDIRSRVGSEKSSVTTHLGMTGVRVGYNQTPDVGFGFTAIASYLQSFNKSEAGADEKVAFFVPSGNLTYGFQKYLTGYAGFNVGVLTAPSDMKKYFKPAIGWQAGLGVRVTKNVALNAGYTVISQQVDYKTYTYSGGEEKQTGYIDFGGFNSNLTYTF